MNDQKIRGIIVTLQDSISEECREELINAIKMLRGVVDASIVNGQSSFHDTLLVRNICARIKLRIEHLINEVDEIRP